MAAPVWGEDSAAPFSSLVRMQTHQSPLFRGQTLKLTFARIPWREAVASSEEEHRRKPKRQGGTAPSAPEFEYDPCSDSPEKLMLHLDEGEEVPIFRHHEPFVDLFELNEKTILVGILGGAIDIDPINASWRCRAHPSGRPLTTWPPSHGRL